MCIKKGNNTWRDRWNNCNNNLKCIYVNKYKVRYHKIITRSKVHEQCIYNRKKRKIYIKSPILWTLPPTKISYANRPPMCITTLISKTTPHFFMKMQNVIFFSLNVSSFIFIWCLNVLIILIFWFRMQMEALSAERS